MANKTVAAWSTGVSFKLLESVGLERWDGPLSNSTVGGSAFFLIVGAICFG